MPDKEAFGVSMEAQLKEWKQRIEAEEEKAQSKGGEYLERVRPELDALRAKYEEARYKLKLLRMGGGDAWDELRAGFDSAYEDMKSAVGKALKKL